MFNIHANGGVIYMYTYMYKNMNLSYPSKDWFDMCIHIYANVCNIHADGGLTGMPYWDIHICVCDKPLTWLIVVCDMMRHMRDMLYSCGVATMRRLLKIIGLFCKRAL